MMLLISGEAAAFFFFFPPTVLTSVPPQKTERLQSCPTCCTSHRMSDMIENKNRESVLSFYCSDRCMMVYMAQSVTLSGILLSTLQS